MGDAGEDVADDAVATDVMEAVAQAEERLSLSPTDMDIEVTEVSPQPYTEWLRHAQGLSRVVIVTRP